MSDLSNNNADVVSRPEFGNTDIITLRDLIDILLRRKRMFMGIVLLFAVVGGLLVFMKTPKYEFTQMIAPAQINVVHEGYLSSQPLLLQSSIDVQAVLDGDIMPLVIATSVDKTGDQGNINLDLTSAIVGGSASATVGGSAIVLTAKASLNERRLVREEFDAVLMALKKHQTAMIATQRIAIQESLKETRQQQLGKQHLLASLNDGNSMLRVSTDAAMPTPQALLKVASTSSSGGAANKVDLSQALNAYVNQQRLEFSTNVTNQINALRSRSILMQQSLGSLLPSRFSGSLIVSDKPVGLHGIVLWVLLLTLGIMLAFFAVLVAEFNRKS